MPADLGNYVYGYTSGIISKNASVKIRFAGPVITEEDLSSDPPAGLIHFSPEIKGIASWEDAQTLSFKPESLLKSGTEYIAKVNLKKVYPDVSASSSNFEFDFRTKDQFFEVEITTLEAPDANDLSRQRLLGKITTADVAEGKEVEGILTAVQNNKNLQITWEHLADETTHLYIVHEISRTNAEGEVSLKWDGKSLGVDYSDKRTIEIPALGNFKILDAKVVQEESPYILLSFSDPLQSSQNLDGLIRLDQYDGQFRFIIDGNLVRVYPVGRLAGTLRLTASPGIKNIQGMGMKQPSQWDIDFQVNQPQVRLVGRGVVMPNSSGLMFPFEAVSLRSVQVEVFKIFNNNILQFLQTNELNGQDDLYRVGKIIIKKTIQLNSLNANAHSGQWTRYALDLGKLIDQDPEAIYQIRIGFSPDDALTHCTTSKQQSSNNMVAYAEDHPGETDYDLENSMMQWWYGPGGYYDDYKWEQREDPCYPAYYNSDRFIRRNVIASNFGLVAKGGQDNSYFVALTDLGTTDPVAGAQLDFFSFQQQLIRSVQTDAQGMATVELPEKPFVVVAKKGVQKGYLRLQDGNSLSLSRFDVSGVTPQKGLKGYLYGDRGVWRPGDSVFLNFVLEDLHNKLPAGYPVQFEITDAKGQLYSKKTVSENKAGLYPLYFKTADSDATGNWMARVKAGGAVFEKILKIETVKPNRIKIDLDFGKDILTAQDGGFEGKLIASWLHGAPAGNLKADVEMRLVSAGTQFPKYKQYVFDDPARNTEMESNVLFDGSLDADGRAQFSSEMAGNQLLPGKMTALFKTRVFERGGDFSTDNYNIDYHPFKTYVGIGVPTDQYGSKQIDVDKETIIQFATLNNNGAAAGNRKLSIGIYRLEWRWWWDEGQDFISRFNSNTHFEAQQRENIQTGGNGEAALKLTINRWGRYLIRVCDEESGHCSGDYVYAGYPWNEEGEEGDAMQRQAAAMLAFTSDKPAYNVGDDIKLTIPAGESGRILVSVENGSKVLESHWLNAEKGENTFSLRATAEMAPTVYAHVSLIQPHGQVNNDLPIRMYGVIPVMVEDAKSKLSPQLAIPDELQPEKAVTVEVSEKTGQAMAYTIDIVDQGLLSLTRFKTPNPWDAFFAREALGVHTWDIYDQVLGAYGAQLERILSIGGDGELAPGEANNNANRFKPVVIHLGPYQLAKGKKAKHTIQIPNYIGEVRAMVVAVGDGAYGSFEKAVPVKKPLMVLATLPRVLGPGEKVDLPVNLFVMDDKVKNASVTVEELNGMAKVLFEGAQSLSFNRPGDKMATFPVEVGNKTGKAKFRIVAKGGGETATQEIEIQVRNPNPLVTQVQEKVLAAGESWDLTFQPFGSEGTNEAVMEVSNMPALNLGKRLNHLIQYPYGCIEQTLSAGFPQLFVDKLMDLDPAQKKEIPENIRTTIDRLRQFQTTTGGFGYWPGDTDPDHWGTNYAGHFLLEAKALGYAVPTNLLDNWAGFQKKVAKMWDPNLKNYGFMSKNSYELTQAYRLYTLALAKQAELGAMNRLRETPSLTLQAKWLLAGAYAAAGKDDVAKTMVRGLSTKIGEYQELSYTYGSEVRDQAMILEVLTALAEEEAGFQLLTDLAKSLSSSGWMSTQEIGYGLLAIGKFMGGQKPANFNFAYQYDNGQTVNAGSKNHIMLIDLPVKNINNKKVNIKNTSSDRLFARIGLRGQPLTGEEGPRADNIKIDVRYKDLTGNTIDPVKLVQGTDFIAEVAVTHLGTRAIPFQEMALAQVFPSGWEVLNTRMTDVQSFKDSSVPDYQDFRDDRVNSFFDIFQGKTQVYRVQLNAAYRGRFYLPAVSCEAMYDNSIGARVAGKWVEVNGEG